MQPLQGIRVIDLSKVLAGPLCGQYLGDLGADVIKIEPVQGGDDTRAWLPQCEGEAATFLAVNRNKRSVAVDLKTVAGREIVSTLLRDADVVLQGFGAGAAKRLGVDYASVAALNPRAIYCEISGYGRDGPMGEEPGYDVMLQAFSGMISTIGEPKGEPVRASFSPVDLGTGMHALSGILAALLQRTTTGKGVYVEVSLLETSLGYMGYMAQNYWMTGKAPERMGTAHPAMSPYQAFSAADGQLMLGVGNDAQWRRFCTVAGLDAHVDDPRFATNAQRVANFDQTVALVKTAMASRTVADWLDVLRQARVPCAPIHTLDQSLAHPQIQARGMVLNTEHPSLGSVKSLAYPVQFDHQERRAQRPPPLLGQHTREVLLQSGYSPDYLDKLARDGSIKLGRSTAPAA